MGVIVVGSCGTQQLPHNCPGLLATMEVCAARFAKTGCANQEVQCSMRALAWTCLRISGSAPFSSSYLPTIGLPVCLSCPMRLDSSGALLKKWFVRMPVPALCGSCLPRAINFLWGPVKPSGDAHLQLRSGLKAGLFEQHICRTCPNCSK